NMSDFTAMESGLVLLPGAVIMGVMSPVTGRIFDRFGASALAISGFALLTITSVMLARLTVDTGFWYIAIVNAVRMFGTAMVMMPVTTAALNQLSPRMIPHGAAVNNTMRQVAASVGTGVLVTVMTAAARDPEEYGAAGAIHGVNVAFLVAAGIAAVGLIGSCFLRGSRPQPPAEAEAPTQDCTPPLSDPAPPARAARGGGGGEARDGAGRAPSVTSLTRPRSTCEVVNRAGACCITTAPCPLAPHSHGPYGR